MTDRRGGRNRRRILGLSLTGVVLLAGGAAVLASGSSPSDTAAAKPSRTAASTPSSTPTPAEPTLETQTISSAASALADLSVRPHDSVTDYKRTAFGAPWTDTDRNGCDTRNDVLRRDLTAAVLKDGTHGCVVLKGSLLDPYTGETLPFVRGASGIQIDHVVALGNAWMTGASSWPYAKLLAFANDPLELLAVDGSQNDSKGDSDAAQWLPPHGDCDYVARQIAIKAKYGLTVSSAEQHAMSTALQSCPDQELPTGGTPTLAPNRSPAPDTSPRAPAVTPPSAQGIIGGNAPDYGSCANAKAHGAGPYYAGKDPEYAYYQDRDHDGIVCE